MIQPKHVSHEDIDERLARGEGRFREIEDKLDNLIEGVAKLTATVEPIRDDISTIKELVRRWYGLTPPEKNSAHRALDDIHESIEELRWYRKVVFRGTPLLGEVGIAGAPPGERAP